VGVAITEKLIGSPAKPRKGAKICYDNKQKGLRISVSALGKRTELLHSASPKKLSLIKLLGSFCRSQYDFLFLSFLPSKRWFHGVLDAVS
jgi:hypothetical protein